MNDKEQKQAPEHQAMQARCFNMPNDEPEGHYWSWVNSPQSVPNKYRECISCGRIDATEWLTSHDQQIALAAIKYALSELRSIEYPPSGKEYHLKDGTWNNNLLSTANALAEEALVKQEQEKN